MKREFETYVHSLEIAYGALFNKIELSIELLQAISPEPEKVVDIFLSETPVRSGDPRVFHSLFLFSERLLLEARNLQDQGQPALYLFLMKEVVGIEVSLSGYRWKDASDSSVLVLNVNLGVFGGAHLRASGQNCDKLKSLYEAHFKPKILVALSSPQSPT